MGNTQLHLILKSFKTSYLKKAWTENGARGIDRHGRGKTGVGQEARTWAPEKSTAKFDEDDQ